MFIFGISVRRENSETLPVYVFIILHHQCPVLILTIFTSHGYPMPGSTLRAYGNTSGVPGSEPIRPIMNIFDTHQWSNRSPAYESGLAGTTQSLCWTLPSPPSGTKRVWKVDWLSIIIWNFVFWLQTSTHKNLVLSLTEIINFFSLSFFCHPLYVQVLSCCFLFGLTMYVATKVN